MRRYLLLWLVAFILLGGCSLHKKTPYVVMVSFDGFRYDYATKHKMPHLQAFIQGGTQAEALISSFPSKTFPNHYSLVTGMYPGNHGLVDNDFYDAERKLIYDIKNREVVQDAAFYGGTPLWQLARQQGMRAASYFWVGSEAAVQGAYPDYYLVYEEKMPNTDRIDQVISWLRLPEQDRPRFISLYFSLLDTQGHNFGPESPQVAEALQEVDGLVGNLMDQIQSLDLPVNVIIVSDHGMVELESKPESFIYIKDLLNVADTGYVQVNGGTQSHIYSKNQAVTDSLYEYLKKKEQHYKVYKQPDFPKTWHYNHPKAGDLLIVADAGYYLVDATKEGYTSKIKVGQKLGKHGYDPDAVKEVAGIFYANGPNIKQGHTIAAFRNIHVYPLVARILNLKTPPDIDGDIKVLEGIYKK